MSSNFDDIVYFCDTGIPAFCKRFSLNSKSCFSLRISAWVLGSGAGVGLTVAVGIALTDLIGRAVAVAGLGAVAGAGAGVLPNNEDIKLGLGAGAGVDAGVGLDAGAGVGRVALVDTLMDGVNLKSVLLSLFKMSDKSVVSLRNEGLLTGVAGVDLVMDIMGWAVGVEATAGVIVFDNVDNEKGSDLALVRSTNSDKSSTGTTRSGVVPPILDVVSWTTLILLTLLTVRVGDCDPLLATCTVLRLLSLDELSNWISLIPLILKYVVVAWLE